MSELDYGLYPSREMQMDWLKVYLQAYKLFTMKTEEVSPRELETLYVQVNKFALVRTNSFANTHTYTQPVTHSHPLCLITSPGLIPSLSHSRLLTSSGASGRSSRPNTPPSTLTSSGKFLDVWVFERVRAVCGDPLCRILHEWCQWGLNRVMKDWNLKP